MTRSKVTDYLNIINHSLDPFQVLYNTHYHPNGLSVDCMRRDLLKLCSDNVKFGHRLSRHFSRKSKPYQLIRYLSCGLNDNICYEDFLMWCECIDDNPCDHQDVEFIMNTVDSCDSIYQSKLIFHTAQIVGPWIDLCKRVTTLNSACWWVIEFDCVSYHYSILYDNIISYHTKHYIGTSDWNNHVPDEFKIAV